MNNVTATVIEFELLRRIDSSNVRFIDIEIWVYQNVVTEYNRVRVGYLQTLKFDPLPRKKL